MKRLQVEENDKFAHKCSKARKLSIEDLTFR